MYNEDPVPQRHLLTNGNQLLSHFYNRRSSVPSNEASNLSSALKKQKILKSKLTTEYVRLLKENNHLREFIKKHHIKIKGQKISSNLDNLSASNKAASLSYHLDLLESKISRIFTYF